MDMRRQLIALYTIVRKETVRIMRIWLQTLVPPVITMTLYFIIFGNLIGRRIGEMGGFDYMQFMAPGLIMMSVITNSYGNVVSSFFAAKFQGHLQEMLIAPMSSAVIILGHVAGGDSTRGFRPRCKIGIDLAHGRGQDECDQRFDVSI